MKGAGGVDCPFCLGPDMPPGERPIVSIGSACAIRSVPAQRSVHVLAVPARHVSAMTELEPDELKDLWAVVGAAASAMGDTSYQVKVNRGRAVGQSVEHLHVHVMSYR
jgi:diadenosine tetraphosphate (Ap4A) HIT family hydrolase